MTSKRIVFRVHALQRMFERHIAEDDVRHVLETGEEPDPTLWEEGFRRRKQ